ncbi:MAG: pyrroloquinoline quinone biosynthesis peptide chaperone PqqD [Pseudomonadales bacterium]|nr:pyrroloquinoline quinone biosynthesis peptide chaperone PqqD [Pseudomonadales bacterium]
MFPIDTQAFVISPHFRFQWEEAQSAWVLLYPEGMVTLNGSAGEILFCFQQPASTREVVARLKQKFPDVDTLEADVIEFVALAVEKSWLVSKT